VTSCLELVGFTAPGELPQLGWLGPDYVAVLIHDLTQGLLRQDPGTQVMGVRCEAEPDLVASVDPAGIIRAHDARFPLQVFVQDGAGRPWCLHGRWTYMGRDLGTPAASISHYWELIQADGA
jgi:hypothetical protein